jgi:murein DD-endopeptidase MepM/ murein hydrolase activator NlpD
LSPVNQYRTLENEIVDKVGTRFRLFGGAISRFFRNIGRRGRQRFTVMLVPHSEKKIFNFQISLVSLVFLSLLLIVVLVAFFGLATHFSGTSRLLTTRAERLESTEANLEVLREEIAELQRVAKSFETTLSGTLNVLGVESSQGNLTPAPDGDLSSFFGVQEVESDGLPELSTLQSLRSYLESADSPLSEIRDFLVSQKQLMVDIPTLWPLKGVRGRITNVFGPAEHPILGGLYLHKGIDIAYGYGIPVVATANGKVELRDQEPLGFGNYVLIRHKYGFATKYAHLQHVYVKKGDEVQRGQVIGTMGSSGLSTGPHLHYEVRIGSQVVDPARYMNISSGLVQSR